MKSNQSLPYWLAASLLPDIGPRKFLRWLSWFSSIENFFHASQFELQAAGLNDKHIEALRSIDWRLVDIELSWLNQPDHYIFTLEDESYPDLLKEITDPPLVLYLSGNAIALKKTQLAIVGARNATPTGIQTAEQFAASLVNAGLVITSGMALGIDGASHRGALKAKGETIAVFGTGLNHIYPTSHRVLAKNILDHEGAIVSEFPLNTLPHKSNFPRRNRIISGLSRGVLVVEAALQSGSLITALQALEQGREVFAIPGSIHQPLTRGCHHLIRQGAKLVETATDILDELLNWHVPHIHQPDTKTTLNLNKVNISPALNQLLSQIDHEITSMDVILLRSGLTASEVSSMLLILELDGYVQSVAGGYIRSIVK